jgi:hypothetical protein
MVFIILSRAAASVLELNRESVDAAVSCDMKTGINFMPSRSTQRRLLIPHDGLGRSTKPERV